MTEQSSLPVAEIDVALLRELMEAGNQLADAAENHWDEIPMGVAVARWEDALYKIGRSL